MRTFQCSDATSHKFWNIAVKDTYYEVTFGKIGSAGQRQRKNFASAAQAQAEADKLVKEKLKKGYVETTPAATASEEEAFHKSLVEHADDLAGWCAYADWLVEHDDPRGEFMQVQIALEDEKLAKAERAKLQKKEKSLRWDHEETWLGPLAPFLLEPKKSKNDWRTNEPAYAFRRGWLADLEIPYLSVDLVRALNRSPEARFLRKLHVHTSAMEVEEDPAVPVPGWADGTYKRGPDLPKNTSSDEMSYHLLATSPRLASIRSFHLGNPLSADEHDTDSCHTDGEMAFHYIKRMPHIEEVRLLAHNVETGKLFALSMPKLRVLLVFHADKYPVDRLAANPSLGNLEHLSLVPHCPEGDEPYLRLRELRAICRATNVPKLRHLALRFTDFGDEGVREVVASGILKRLKVLDLSYGCVTDEGAGVLAAAPDAKNLDRLVLDTNALTSKGVKALKAAGIKVSAKTQHNEVPPFEEGEMPEYFYEADYE